MVMVNNAPRNLPWIGVDFFINKRQRTSPQAIIYQQSNPVDIGAEIARSHHQFPKCYDHSLYQETLSNSMDSYSLSRGRY